MSRAPLSLLPARRAGARLLTAGAAAALVAGGGLLSAAPAHAAVPAAATAHPTITPGERHAAVPYLKRRFDVPNSTRVYGATIASRVARFEQRRGWRDDNGTVTAATWRALGVPYVAPLTFRERVLAEASRHAGKQYVYGTAGPSTFDCSGFTQYVYRQEGRSLPRTAAAQRGATTRISAANVRPGDLVFVHGSSGVYHAAIYAGPGMWWEAGNAATDVGKHRAWSGSVSYGRL
jgi:cell wall-associated NlpC family hydrolase